jgi:alpha-L-fucosidase
MATFGLVGDLITMWTNTDDPYGRLIRQDEVHEQMDIDLANGKTTSSWVPTPHVVLDIIENENFNSVLMGNEELTRMKEQIRRCKPIQVVFDGIRIVFNGTIDIPLKLVSSGGTVEDSTCILGLEPDTELAVDPCMEEDCDF